MPNEKDKNETSLVIQELHPISASMGDYVTVKMERWHYHIDRSKLILVEGTYTKEELEKVLDKCNRADASARAESSPSSDCPRHFTLACRPLDLVKLAREILTLYKGYESILY